MTVNFYIDKYIEYVNVNKLYFFYEKLFEDLNLGVCGMPDYCMYSICWYNVNNWKYYIEYANAI